MGHGAAMAMDQIARGYMGFHGMFRVNHKSMDWLRKKSQSTIFLPANFRIFVSTFRCKSGKTWFDSNRYSKHMLVEFSLEPTPKNGALTCQKSKQKPKVAEKRTWAQHSDSPHFPLIHAPINYRGW